MNEFAEFATISSASANSSFHALAPSDKKDFSPKTFQLISSFYAHTVGHGKKPVYILFTAHAKCQCDARCCRW